MISELARGVLTFGIGWAIFKSLKRVFWRSPLDNLPGPPGGSFLAGHFNRVFTVDAWDYHKHLAMTYGSVVKLRGVFGAKALFVYDPKALHHIFIKDQHIFDKTEGFAIAAGLVWGEGLFATSGEQHRKQGKMLSSVFSGARMRNMVPTFYDVTHKLRDTFLAKVSTSPKEIDVLDWMSRTTLELIGQSNLGYTFESLAEDSKEHTYTRELKKFPDIYAQLTPAREYVLPWVYNIGTPAFRRWVVDHIPWKPLRELRDIADVMKATSNDIIGPKQRAMQEGNEAVADQVRGGDDFLNVLLRENMKASGDDRLTDEELLGQVSTLTHAAMDTTSSAVSRVLWLLSHNVDAQNKLREEIRQAHDMCGGDRLGYDELVSLPFLDAVCRETLRLHPPAPTTVRETREDVILPFSKPVRGIDGSEMYDVLVPKGTMVFPSFLSSNCDPDLWGPDSYEWKPERWIEGLPSSVTDAKLPGVDSHLMTFSGGKSACIGFKLAQLEMKVVLCVLLDKFKFAPANGKEIEWKMAVLVTPAVVGELGVTQLPLEVSLAD
ncbi:cytochrome P450 [Coprinellus micaceus]|uniref:Cytochrome P450 n=1 Tax=Coprinellus micaceus TaxID=71717 RepID=A0A4Y7U168_COPMI|nr:cytochrome P450 [Coprinellus micaceus]